MSGKQNFIIGLFVLAGLALLLVMLFAFGAADSFTPKVRLVTWYSESVQGLAKGSPVKYKGVPIGKVDAITIQIDGKLIRVEMEIELAPIYLGQNLTRNAQEAEFRGFVEQESSRGLRCRLEYSGLTGTKFVEIDYFAQHGETPPAPAGNVGAMLYIPSKASTLSDTLEMVSTSLKNISSVDFGGIAKDLRDTMHSFDKLLNDPHLATTLQNLDAMSANLQASTQVLAETLTEAELKSLLSTLHNSAESLTSLAGEMSEQLQAAQLPESTAAFRRTLDAITASRTLVDKVAVRISRTLNKVDELAETLAEDPSSVLRGKRRAPVDMESLER